MYRDLRSYLRKRDLYNKTALWVNHTKKDLLVTWEHPFSPFFPLTARKFLTTYLDAEDLVESTDVYNVLHYNSRVSMVIGSGNINYVRFEYSSLEVARKRAAYLALLSYQYRDGVFLRLFTRDMIEDGEFMERYAANLRQVHAV